MNSSQLRKLPLNDIQIQNTINYVNSIKKITKNLILLGPHLEPNIEIEKKKFYNKNLD